MDIGSNGMMRFLNDVGSKASSQCFKVTLFILIIFVIISRQGGLGFGTFAGNELRWVARGSQSLISYPILNNSHENMSALNQLQRYVEEH
jgi:hypothetical protein